MSLTIEQKKAELCAAIARMPNESVEVLTSVVMEVVNQKGVAAIFLSRALRALVTMASEASVAEAATAPSDYDLLLTLLQRPEVVQALPSRDPLAAAKIRGLLAKRQLLEVEGGCMTSEEVSEVLSITRQAVDKRRKQGKLIGLAAGRVYVYPSWQFHNGQTLSGLEKVLQALGVRDPWMQTAWILNGNSRLEGRSPLDVLREGKVDNLNTILDAACLYGEQGAS